MALVESSNQYKYTGKGPLDKKALVATYKELTTWDTWVTKSGSKTAYNTMIVGVWANREDPSKNGVYYLFDPTCTSTIKNPDVTNVANWHKIAESTDLSANFEELTSKVQILDVTVNGNEDQEGLVTKVTKNDAAILAVHNEVTAVQLEVNEIKSAVDNNTAKLIGITTTVLDAIESVKSAPATEEKLGSIKSGSGDNVVSVDEHGIASVKTVNIKSLTQGDDETLILNGGSAFAL